MSMSMYVELCWWFLFSGAFHDPRIPGGGVVVCVCGGGGLNTLARFAPAQNDRNLFDIVVPSGSSTLLSSVARAACFESGVCC